MKFHTEYKCVAPPALFLSARERGLCSTDTRAHARTCSTGLSARGTGKVCTVARARGSVDLGKNGENRLGGYGSGRPSIRPAFETALRIDLASATTKAALSAESLTSGTWNWHSGDVTIGSVRYVLNSSRGTSGSLHLRYVVSGIPTSQTVELVTSRPNFGGLRWWFVCPAFLTRHERRLVRCICLPAGQHYFASRAAHRLNYQSQKDSRNLSQFIGRLMGEFA